jgi:hypothetical protein
MVIAIDRRNIYTEGLPRGGLFRLHHHARNEVYDLLPHDSFKAGDMHLIGPSFTAGASTTNRKKVQWRRHKFSIKEAYDSRDAGAAGRPEAIGLGAGSNPQAQPGQHAGADGSHSDTADGAQMEDIWGEENVKMNLKVWCEAVGDLPIYAVSKAVRWSIMGEAKEPSVAEFVRSVRQACGHHVLEHKRELMRLAG